MSTSNDWYANICDGARSCGWESYFITNRNNVGTQPQRFYDFMTRTNRPWHSDRPDFIYDICRIYYYIVHIYKYSNCKGSIYLFYDNHLWLTTVVILNMSFFLLSNINICINVDIAVNFPVICLPFSPTLTRYTVTGALIWPFISI